MIKAKILIEHEIEYSTFFSSVKVRLHWGDFARDFALSLHV